MTRPATTTGALSLGSFLLALPLSLACGDKEPDFGGDGGVGDGGSEDCTLDLAPAGDVSTDPTCEAVVDKLAGLEVEWQWTGSSLYETYTSIVGPPAVGDLDGDGIPEIVFTATDPAKTSARPSLSMSAMPTGA